MRVPKSERDVEEFSDALRWLSERKAGLRAFPELEEIFRAFWEEHPELRATVGSLLKAFWTLREAFGNGHRLFLCGNGGSFADALHISGELMKSYLRARPLPEEHRTALRALGGEELADSLQPGLPAIVLGLNHSLLSALENDVPVPRIGFAQELYCLGRKGDVLLGISTSGRAVNVLHAVKVAKLREMGTIAMTGREGGPLAEQVDCAIRVPAAETRRAQEMHQAVYHTLCAMLEAEFFPDRGTLPPP